MAQVDDSLTLSSVEHASSAGTSTASSLRFMSGPAVMLAGMEIARVEADLQGPSDALSGTIRTKRAASCRAIVGGDWTSELAVAWGASHELLMNAVELNFRRSGEGMYLCPRGEG